MTDRVGADGLGMFAKIDGGERVDGADVDDDGTRRFTCWTTISATFFLSSGVIAGPWP